ncbi:galactose mutarotase [Halanaerobiaceae bacterium Z-7014]|uniref:Aldose 1-epimerase n=1 Tax=Halonatronomonas betaini TaxID=2778430 RepID=A0A931AS24_9FIRM|nr:aldose epimerase family protein [Halonatronomonas betaini]MBF8436836.1 galactose mutarotase [Halonatronomonas betaini]
MTVIEKEKFGIMPDGREVNLFSLENSNGMRAEIIEYGGIISKLIVPLEDGPFRDVVLGYDKLEYYIEDKNYFGALIGRYGNRIGGAAYTYKGDKFQLDSNPQGNCLHGGSAGFNKQLWSGRIIENETGEALQLSYNSSDGEAGFPGNLKVKVIVSLTEDNSITFDYRAETDRPTPVNLTQHSYYNLNGESDGQVLDHKLMINADQITEIDQKMIPTGSFKNAAGTPFDFRSLKPIGQDINKSDNDLELAGGYDHNWVLNQECDRLTYAGLAVSGDEKLKMKVYTTKPGMQFYSGNSIVPAGPGKSGRVYNDREGFCLETQFFPDSPNQKDFPDTILKPGQVYNHRTIYNFY